VVKKITISVPDELHEKMMTWKNSFNFSRVFQEAMGDLIRKKEEFNKRLKGGTDMTEVIERLKKEKYDVENECFEEGKEDGLEWAKVAHYADLQEAINWNAQRGDDPTRHANEQISENFKSILGEHEYPDLGFDVRGLANDALDKFVEGWIEGVQEFWNEVKSKI
jgi:hypothetical protein